MEALSTYKKHCVRLLLKLDRQFPLARYKKCINFENQNPFYTLSLFEQGCLFDLKLSTKVCCRANLQPVTFQFLKQVSCFVTELLFMRSPNSANQNPFYRMGIEYKTAWISWKQRIMFHTWSQGICCATIRTKHITITKLRIMSKIHVKKIDIVYLFP